jgi:L-iditol 2-dehydrogenase
MREMMHALVLHGLGDLRYEQVPRPTPQEGEALVRVAAAGVCGSDVPRVYVHGTYRFPLILGHELSGVIEHLEGSPGPHAAPDLRVGQPVVLVPLVPCRQCAYCQVGAYAQCTAYDYLGSRSDGGFAEVVRVPQANLLPLPEGVALLDAALTEPAAVALHAMRQGKVQPGDAVAILGTGPIGMILAQWASILGAGRVLLVDIDARKLSMARDLHLGEVFNARQGDPVTWVQELTQGRGADVVIEAAGTSVTLEQSLRAARPLGHVVIMGNPSSEVKLPQSTVSQILRKELTIRGTWNSSFASLPTNEWRVVLEMLSAGRLNLRPLITHQVPLGEGVAALEMMRDQREFYGRVVLVNEG